jgi:two-component system response regulator AtoC
MPRKRILVIDDEPYIQLYLAELLKRMHYNVSLASTGKKALSLLLTTSYDLVITDLRLPDISGMEVLQKIKELPIQPGVILITAYASVENAVAAMKQGAYDYIKKPLSSAADFQVVVENYFKYNALLHNRVGKQVAAASDDFFNGFIAESPKMRELVAQIKLIAPTKATVLIQGESGTGKEVIASAIHQVSDRRDKPFIRTNCAAITETLVESEMFGHEKGAFTGADRSTKGRFEMADKGVLLLDEISEMNPGLQAKLLRVLQEGEIEKVGNPVPIKVDVRVIATTNRKLILEIEKGSFREDLYYRLNVVPLFVPPLNERKEDIIPLVKYFVDKYTAKNNKPIESVDESALEQLLAYDWPGNVRELENSVERAVIICPGEKLMTKHFFAVAVNPNTKLPPDQSAASISEVERIHILRILKQQKANRTRAAKILGISIRTLRNKLNEYRQTGFDVDGEEAIV